MKLLVNSGVGIRIKIRLILKFFIDCFFWNTKVGFFSI